MPEVGFGPASGLALPAASVHHKQKDMSARKALARAAAMAATADALLAEVFSACDDSTEAIGMANTGPVVQVPNSLEVGVPAGSSWHQPSRAW